ncbi:MAG: arsenate reductase (glutaredoxin) [Rhodobacterales bacterium]|nr:arsenate reductase (glutaredoxin) [Rhodobacterales bacterium]
MITIWHHPRCSKSRQTLALLEEHGGEITIRKYQEDAPSTHEIRAALTALDLDAIDVIRTGEALFKTLGLSRQSESATLIAAMADNPVLIERPIVFATGRAAIGRPPENVFKIL